MGRIAIVLAALVCTLTATSAEAATVTSGSLTARTTEDPWSLVFTTTDGATVLREKGPSLGFRDATTGAWRRATKVIEDAPAPDSDNGARRLRLATTDPQGRTLAVTLEPDGEGVIRLIALPEPTTGIRATGITFELQASERLLGFGERSNAVDQRGADVENYVTDGPYEAEERLVLAAFVPPEGYHPRDDATYFPMPWLLSSKGHGVLVENTERSEFRLGTDDPQGWAIEADAPRLELRVFAGPTPADALARLTRHTGRQPKPAAPWIFGPWTQPRGSDPAQEIATLRREKAPVSVAQTYLHYLPCGDHVGRRDRERDRVAKLHAQGVATTTYFNPMICTTYQPVFDQAAGAGALTKRKDGSPYTYRYASGLGPDREFTVGQVDFSHPPGVQFFHRLLQEAVDDGHDGWMEDFGEYTPRDSLSADGQLGYSMHSRYPVLYHRAAYEFASRQQKPVVSFIRSGYTGVHPYAQVVWGGDPTVGWGFDGLSSAVTQTLSIGLSGISRWGSDIGGFFALGNNPLTPELMTRWIQFGAVSGVMRMQSGGVSLPSQQRAQITDAAVLPAYRRYARLRTRLYPYLAAADATYRATGLPLTRHHALTHPDDPEAIVQDRQFMVGPDLLAAPVLAPGQRERPLYLPEGEWIDLWRTVDADLAPQRSPELITGRRRLDLPAPLDELPLLVRAGTILPLLPDDVETLASYGDQAITLEDRRARLDLLAFPRGTSTATAVLAHDDLIRLGSRVLGRPRARRWSLRLSGAPRRLTVRLRATLGTARLGRRPCQVRVGDRPLPPRSWSYEPATRALTVTYAARRGATTLTALTRCPAR